MKRFVSLLMIILFHNSILLTAEKTDDIWQIRRDRTEWFRDARFGMFIHWGLYAIPARGEWVRNKEQLSNKDYEIYFNEFNPVEYDPEEWARAAKNAGMKYVVMTAKHHDGFCLFDSKYTDYNSTNTPIGKDLIKEYVQAFRSKGLKVGFYYSLLDWHHPDYPHYCDPIHPMRENKEFENIDHNFDQYVEYLHNQVRELLTNYGKIDIMWFDFSYGKLSGEAWKATDLVKMVRDLQPGIIIDNRLGGHIEAEEPEPYAGDFEGPEQVIPSRGVFDENGRRIPWEVCLTLNNHWGYCATDRDFKSPQTIIRALVNCVSKSGNLLLNVGPDAMGNIPQECLDILDKVGMWINRNGNSIYGCQAAAYPKPEWGRYTQQGNKLYAHIFEQSIGQICLEGLKGKVVKARLLEDGSEVFISDFWLGGDRSFIGDQDIFINFGKPIQHTYILPDKMDTVVELELID
jgi:alpha-L-fucosidase